jgi:hypothetical protein
MFYWLGGTGRSPEDLARLVTESNSGKETPLRYRRSHHRHELANAHGELIYKESVTPCRVIEISAGGCSLETDRPFRPGALAPVEVVLPILGMVLHIGGVTQWMKGERKMGVFFNHVNARSKNQLEGLIACLIQQSSAEFVKTSVASPSLNPLTGDVLAVRPIAPKPVPLEFPEGQEDKGAYDASVHCGDARLRAENEGEWHVAFRSPDNRFRGSGALLDLSLAGCTVQTARMFAGEVDDPIEVDLAMQGLHFLVGGVVKAIYDPQTIGIQLNPMNVRRRETFALLILELCAATRTRIQAA